MIFELFGVCVRLGKDPIDHEVEGIIYLGIERVSAACFDARVGANVGVRSVFVFAKHEKVWLSNSRGIGVKLRTPILPATKLDMFNRVDSKAVETSLLDPKLVYRSETRTHVGRFGF